jgi:spore germination protein
MENKETIKNGAKKVEILNDEASKTTNNKNQENNISKTNNIKTKKTTTSKNGNTVKSTSKKTVKKVAERKPINNKPTKSKNQKSADKKTMTLSERMKINREQAAEKMKIRKEKAAQKKAEMSEKMAQRKAEMQQMKVAKEKQRAKKRVQMAKLNDEKKMQKEKAAEAKKVAAKRRITAMKEASEKKRQERIARHELLKNETKDERIKRIKKEKAENLKIKREKRILAERLKHERMEANKLKAEKRAAERRERHEDEKSKGYAGWLAAVIALGVTVLALGSMLTMMYQNQTASNTLLSNSYEKSFYDLVSYVDNLDVNLSKLQVSNSEAEQQKLLTNVVVHAELAENNVQQLPIEDESKSNTVGFINSVGDYARSLIAKIAAGETLTNEEKDNLEAIYEVNLKLKTELSDLAANLGNDYKFITLLKANEGDAILTKFNELENNSVEYPKLIYDGPFSAGLESVEPKGLDGETEISKEEASEKYREYFKDYNITDVDFMGEVTGRYFDSYNLQGTTDDAKVIFAQISKKGGKLIMFNLYSDCTTVNFDADKCVEIATDYLNSIGLNNMKAVWINDSGNVANINFAYEENDVIVYSDLIKVKVCEERGEVIGIEAMTYYLNHTESRDTSTSVSMAQARAKVSDKINILTQRLTIIPKSGGSEVTAYEFMGTYKGATYYVYINAKTGNEAEVFKVIESTEGNLLM